MKMESTPKGMRVQIGIYGRRNVGKSSVLNALTRQQVSIVSDVAGTTTDPVEKAMEMLPIGPVLFIDTAGIDDIGALGEKRVTKTRKIIERTDIALLVTSAAALPLDSFEQSLLDEFRRKKVPVIVVVNRCDEHLPAQKEIESLQNAGLAVAQTAAVTGEGMDALRVALINAVPAEMLEPHTIAGDLIPKGEMAMLVVPIDLEAPKGRLILPQVQTVRDILDHDSYCMVAKESELRAALGRLNRPPALVVTDSQAFRQVSEIVPPEIPLTSFSILFARLKGDLPTFVEGAMAIDRLKPGDRVLVAEACTHHPIGEDIGRVKIPQWLREYVGGDLHFDTVQGADFPEDISRYQLIIHCGSCTFNRRQLLTRIVQCRELNIPMTNYGLAIAFSLGIFARALEPFPQAREIYLRGPKKA